MKLSFREHPYKLSAVMALAVALLFNLCLLLFFAYGEYLMKSYGFGENEAEIRMERPVMEQGAPDIMKAPPHAMDEPKPMMDREKPEMDERGFHIMMFVTKLIIHFLATFILFAICFNILFRWKSEEWKRITVVALASVVWILLFALFTTHFMAPQDFGGPGRIHFVRAMTTISLFLGLTVFLSSLLIYYVNQGHEAAIENETLRTLNYSNQYEALRSKLDPHFLFNALNTLSGLIAIRSEHSEEYIQKLSAIFRTTLSHEDVSLLSDEVGFASAYGDLMTIRYEDALTINYNIPDEFLRRRIVSFGVQSLLENVIKHNTISKRLPMEISITAEGDYVTVSNPIHPRKGTAEGNGLGLSLLSQRCIALLEKDIIIESDENTFIVKIPID